MRIAPLLGFLLAACSRQEEAFPGYRELVRQDTQVEASQTVHAWRVRGPSADSSAALPFEVRVASETVVAGDANRLELVRVVARAEPNPAGGTRIVVRAMLDAGRDRTEGAREYEQLSAEDLMGLVQLPAERIELRPLTSAPLVQVAGEVWSLVVQ